jgi:ferrochelatase
MAYGGPVSLDAVHPFMCELMGREPSDEVLERVRRRYLVIGGASPLPQIVQLIATELQSKIAEFAAVGVAYRYCSPTIAETLHAMYAEGFRRVVTVSLSPFESKTTTVAYAEAVREAVADLPDMEIVEAPPLNTLSDYALVHAGSLSVAIQDLDEAVTGRILIVFTAHSLPLDDLESDERYVSRVRAVSTYIAERIGLGPGEDFCDDTRLPGIATYGNLEGERGWVLGFQSKGQRPGEWLGPDLTHVIDAAKEAGYSAVVVSPVGFATEHMETLYDLDVEAAGHALDIGLEWSRAAAPNDEGVFIDAIAAMLKPLIDPSVSEQN